MCIDVHVKVGRGMRLIGPNRVDKQADDRLDIYRVTTWDVGKQIPGRVQTMMTV